MVKYLTEQVKMIEKGRLRGKKLVDVSWFTLCMKEKSLAPIKNDHLLLLAVNKILRKILPLACLLYNVSWRFLLMYNSP